MRNDCGRSDRSRSPYLLRRPTTAGRAPFGASGGRPVRLLPRAARRAGRSVDIAPCACRRKRGTTLGSGSVRRTPPLRGPPTHSPLTPLPDPQGLRPQGRVRVRGGAGGSGIQVVAVASPPLDAAVDDVAAEDARHADERPAPLRRWDVDAEGRARRVRRGATARLARP